MTRPKALPALLSRSKIVLPEAEFKTWLDQEASKLAQAGKPA